MGLITTIEWTHHTFNPWWGCTKVSPGCLHCYAHTWATRLGWDLWGCKAPRRTFGDEHWAEPLRWNRKAEAEGERRRVFCASMADVFDPDAPAGERQRLWDLIEQTPNLDWQVLTKRTELAQRYLPGTWWRNPLPNVWMGASVEDRKRLVRIDQLRKIPAVIHFLSIEPLLEDLGELKLAGIDWVITGGESGAGARPMEAAWVRSIRRQCRAAGVAFFHKQWGKLANNPDVNDATAKENGGSAKGGCTLDGRTWRTFPLTVIGTG